MSKSAQTASPIPDGPAARSGYEGPYKIRLAGYRIGEEELEAVREVFASGILTNGPRTSRFEEVFARRHQVDFAVAFANGTVALTAIYLALGIGQGDEVIVPSMTFISSATSVLHAAATPVFADVDPDTFNLDPVDVARRITRRTRAILAVHYGGQPADMDELQALADDAGLLLLEDAAEAHGAIYRGRSVGGLGKAAMFSFTPTKNITTGEGGIVTTHDGDLAAALKLLRNHGQTSLYQHNSLGFNWRMTELQAAIGEVQVGRLDTILAVKQSNAARMADRLRSVSRVRPPTTLSDRRHVHMLYTLLLDKDRDSVMAAMASAGIETRIYFPPAHRQPIFATMNANLPVTEEVSKRMLSIPFHSLLTPNDMEEIASALEAAVTSGPEGLQPGPGDTEGPRFRRP